MVEPGLAALVLQRCIHEVHRWFADKACDPGIDGLVVNFTRASQLLQNAFVHDGDLVCHGHGFELIMRHIDHRCAEGALKMLDFTAHMSAQFCIQMGDGFVKQEKLGFAHNSAANGNALLLPTGQFLRAALKQLANFQKIGR